jgi:hypothetical protein
VSAGTIITLAILGVAIALGYVAIYFRARARWRVLKPELFPEASGSAGETGGGSPFGPVQFGKLLAQMRSWLAGLPEPEAKRALEALARIEASSQALAAVQELAGAALASADIASLLLGSGDKYEYVVVAPNRYEHANLLRRYPAFAGGWCEHFAALRDRLAADGAFGSLVAFMFFLDPDNGASVFLYSFADKAHMLVPASLMESGASAGETAVFNALMEFNLAA